MPLDGLVELWDIRVAPEPIKVHQCQGRFEIVATGDMADWQADALLEALKDWIDHRRE
jgi:hypothetical protein